ncbi:hypothetical protein [Flavobacterium sp. DG2-3]|uniref:hypothetical protein n=1 Tax=Flavobacterium sp. DG2-3 TaxID=3068317 RepID=UPI00273DC2C9|nr:hypothetical protein [Flavobacterium sp. DG2-3]MDP5199839.1 hypothetical protein [Flavobacterium sp. DG2-3]
MSININSLIDALYNYYNEHTYVKLNIEYEFTQSGSYKFLVRYVTESGEIFPTIISPRAIDDEIEIISDYFEETIHTDKKFNRFILELNNDKTYSQKHFWDNEKEKQDLLRGAEVFYQWTNDRMMSMIFEYEKENGLVPTQLDDDGDLEYLSSWDSGLFTFHINDKSDLEYKISLTKDGKVRILDMPLKDYFIEGIFEHHKITNTELTDEWQSWNTMELKSPHYHIPYDKRDEFVRYI